ncbi:MAG: hypothetical protein L6Q54_02175 [Leptospiraceae bacterium]|nr:hypothetical protein [Leptospiraceae bacterium]MCK6380045.1 hypothetical protein [Leptospiraceae bacterium]NUM42823.1 hypothetical protein [Leptospiraceae bacterium]
MSSKEVFLTKEIYRAIGFKLRFLREDKGYTLNQICDLIFKKYSVKINPNLLGKIERAESKIQTHLFLLFCKFYNLNSSFFLNENKEEAISKSYSNFDSIISTAEGRELLLRVSEIRSSKIKLEIANDILRSLFSKLDKIIHDNLQDKNEFILKAASSQKSKKT